MKGCFIMFKTHYNKQYELIAEGDFSKVLIKKPKYEKTTKYFAITLFISTFAPQRCAHLCILMLIPWDDIMNRNAVSLQGWVGSTQILERSHVTCGEARKGVF